MAFDASIPNAARIYDFMLGGKDNFAADRDAAQQLLAILPGSAGACRDNREFLQRSVRFLAGEAGIRQFLDIGTGLPTMGNVHEVAQETSPGARVAYVDYDPVVLAHARALLATSPAVTVADGDLRDPDAIIRHPDVRTHLDFSQPVAILLVAVLHFLTDDEYPCRAVRTLMDALPSGSYLVLTHITSDDVPEDVSKAAQAVYDRASAPATPRSFSEVAGFFDGLELVTPGLVNVTSWRPGPASPRPSRASSQSLIYGGVAAKP